MATTLIQTLTTPRDTPRWYVSRVYKDGGVLSAGVDQYVKNKCTYTIDVTDLENGNIQVVTKHVFPNHSDYEAYATWWATFDAERLAYHAEHGQTYSSSVTTE
jgi:hypothetical protein